MRLKTLAAAAALLATAALTPSIATAHDFTVGELTIDHPIARLNIGDRPSAGFMTIVNAGQTPDRLIAAASPAFGRIELHTHIVEDGVARMREIEGIDVPAGGVALLEPGGLHLMFFDPDESVAEAAFIEATLTFEDAGDVRIVLMTRTLGEMGGGHGSMDHGTMDHGSMDDGSGDHGSMDHDHDDHGDHSN